MPVNDYAPSVCVIFRGDVKLHDYRCIRNDVKLPVVTNVYFLGLRCAQNYLLLWSATTLNYFTAHAWASVRNDTSLPTFVASLSLRSVVQKV